MKKDSDAITLGKQLRTLSDDLIATGKIRSHHADLALSTARTLHDAGIQACSEKIMRHSLYGTSGSAAFGTSQVENNEPDIPDLLPMSISGPDLTTKEGSDKWAKTPDENIHRRKSES
jgi:hypothetical protein